MVLTVTSMKGGVGKTTIAAMLSRYIADNRDVRVLIVDLDPQGGVSSILLGGQIEPPTIYDVLQMEADGNPSGDLLAEALRRSRYHDRIFVVPAIADLAALGYSGYSLDLLRSALENAPLPEDIAIIVDTGSMPALVAQGIAAADAVLVPVMLSQQTARPTINTLKLALNHRRRRGALIPMGIGKTNWETKELDRWTQKLQSSPALVAMGFDVLPGMPYSKIVVRGRWRYGKFPQRFIPPMDAISEFFLDKPASSIKSLEKEIDREPPRGKIMRERELADIQSSERMTTGAGG